MSTILVKAYGWLEPADEKTLDAVEKILRSWYLEDGVFLDGQTLRISHEGEYFPHEDIAEALAPFLKPESKGKLDILDLEAWTLRRYFFDSKENLLAKGKAPIANRVSPLDRAIENCQNKM